jgi:serine/threonine protein kinase
VRSIYILQRLRHPNLIRCLNYIISPDQDGTIYLLFDACKKGSLADLKTDLTTRKLYTIIRLILLQLADALSYLKAMKVAHRDIKVPLLLPAPKYLLQQRGRTQDHRFR